MQLAARNDWKKELLSRVLGILCAASASDGYETLAELAVERAMLETDLVIAAHYFAAACRVNPDAAVSNLHHKLSGLTAGQKTTLIQEMLPLI